MSDWVIRCSELLSPLVDEFKSQLLNQPVIHADETPLKVIKVERASS
ncbi:MAG: transposase [Flavobacteriales bacterium]|jgi:transposase